MKLEIRPGALVTALWEGCEPVDALKDLFNRDVVIEGKAVFRPSATLLRLDADAIAAATPKDEFFRNLPSGSLTRNFARATHLRPGEKTPYAKVLGSIPDEESDEEFAAAVEARS